MPGACLKYNGYTKQALFFAVLIAWAITQHTGQPYMYIVYVFVI